MIPKKISGHRRAKGNFKACLDYALGENKEQTKQPLIVASNMIGQTPAELAAEFREIQPLSGRCSDPVWHISLSAHKSEHFSDEQWADFGRKLIDKVGVKAKANEIGISTDNNQFVIVRHHNEEHEHIHLVLNRVNFEGKTCYCSWDKNDLHAACAELEAEYDLVQCDHGKAKREGYEKKDPRDLSPWQLARLEEAENKGIVDPKLEQYRELMHQVETEAKKSKSSTTQSVAESDQPARSSESQSPARSLRRREKGGSPLRLGKNLTLDSQENLDELVESVSPTQPESLQEPKDRQEPTLSVSQQQRDYAARIYKIAINLFNYGNKKGNVVEAPQETFTLTGKNYQLSWHQEKVFSISSLDGRGELVRTRTDETGVHLVHADQIKDIDLERFSVIKQQLQKLELQYQRNVQRNSRKEKKQIEY